MTSTYQKRTWLSQSEKVQFRKYKNLYFIINCLLENSHKHYNKIKYISNNTKLILIPIINFFN